MPAPLLLVASLVTFSDERVRAPAAPQEQCVELRQFRANGGCRVAVDRSFAWLCLSETAGTAAGQHHLSIKTEDGAIVKQFAYDRRNDESWGDHSEIFFTAADKTANPDAKIGIAKDKDSTVVVGKARYCLPAQAAKTLKGRAR